MVFWTWCSATLCHLCLAVIACAACTDFVSEASCFDLTGTAATLVLRRKDGLLCSTHGQIAAPMTHAYDYDYNYMYNYYH